MTHHDHAARVEASFALARDMLDQLLYDLAERGTFDDGEASAHVEAARRRLAAGWEIVRDEVTAQAMCDAPEGEPS